MIMDTINLFFELYFTRKKKKKFGGFPLKFPQRILWVGTQNVFIYALLRIRHVFDVSVDSYVPGSRHLPFGDSVGEICNNE